MKNKNFSNKKAEHLEAEKKLLPRLVFMGYVMIVLCVATLGFAIAAQHSPAVENTLAAEGAIAPNALLMALMDDENLREPSPTEILNFYVVSAIFAVVGATCFFIVWKKRKIL